MTERKKAPCLATLQGAIDAALQDLDAARATEDLARRRATEALNLLNRAYADLEEALAVIRGAAPHGSDWHKHRLSGRDLPEPPPPIESRRLG